MKTKNKFTTTARAAKANDLNGVLTNPDYKHEAEKALARLLVRNLLNNEYRFLALYGKEV